MSKKSTPELGAASSKEREKQQNIEATNVEIPDDPYANDTPLTWVFGDNERVRIIAALLSERERGLEPEDVVRISGVPVGEATEALDVLNEWGIVNTNASSSEELIYRIDMENPITQRIHEVESLLLKRYYRR